MYAPHLYNLVKNFTQPREIIWPPAYNNFTEIGTIHSQSLLYRQNKYINIFREIYFTPSLTALQVQCSRNIYSTFWQNISPEEADPRRLGEDLVVSERAVAAAHQVEHAGVGVVVGGQHPAGAVQALQGVLLSAQIY